MSVAYPNFIDWREQNSSFDHLAATRFATYNFTSGNEPERLTGAQVSASMFRALGVESAIGRTLADDDDKPGAERVTVISHGLWLRRFGGDSEILGRTMTLSGSHSRWWA